MSIPEDRKYTADHEWVKMEGGEALVGITEFAQSELGEIVFVDLPASGKQVKQKDTLCVVESTKAASDVYAPLTGRVTKVNTELASTPQQVNAHPYDQGWMVRLTDLNQGEVGALLSADQYRELLAGKK